MKGLAEIRRRVSVPVSEHVFSLAEAFRYAQAEALDVFNISLAALGGISEARRAYAVAEAAGIGTLVGTTQELSIGTAAQLHLACAMPNYTHPGDCTGPVLYVDDIVVRRVRFERSHAVVPDGVGWGVDLDDRKLEELKAPLTMLQAAHA